MQAVHVALVCLTCTALGAAILNTCSESRHLEPRVSVVLQNGACRCSWPEYAQAGIHHLPSCLPIMLTARRD